MIQTGSYTNREGQKVYTTDVVVDDQEFADSKAASDSYRGSSDGYAPSRPQQSAGMPSPDDAAAEGFMNIPDSIEEELPFT